MPKKQVAVLSTALGVVLALLAGCGQNASTPAEGKTDKKAAPLPQDEKAELSFYFTYGEETFNTTIKNLIAAKYPNYKINLITKMDITTGDIPDILNFGSTASIQTELIDKGLAFDLTELVKKHGFDLNSINDSIMQDYKAYSEGKLYALPRKANAYYLYYNKDIFDRFNVPYPPKDKPLTWDEAYELAKRLTRTDNGVNYRGIEFNPGTMLSELSPTQIDPKTDESVMSKDAGYNTWIGTLQKFYSIPGLITETTDPKKQMATVTTGFIKDMNVAIWVGSSFNLDLVQAEKDNGLKWDAAPYPVFADKPGVGPSLATNTLSINPKTVNKDAAFKVIAYLLSEEYQREVGKLGNNPPTLKAKSILDTYGSSNADLKGKNIQAGFVNKAAPMGPFTIYSGIAANDIAADLIKTKKDINTVLRDADEQSNKKVAQQKLSRGAKGK